MTAPHCQEALDILLSHKEAIETLGAPVGIDAKFNFADRRSYKVDDKKKTFWVSGISTEILAVRLLRLG